MNIQHGGRSVCTHSIIFTLICRWLVVVVVVVVVVVFFCFVERKCYTVCQIKTSHTLLKSVAFNI